MTDDAKLRVLIVDDDESASTLLTNLLGQISWARFDVDRASNFREGAEALARRLHDVYLIDYVIGPDSGIELVREARARNNLAPMILITGRGRHEVDVEAMEAGVSDYLDKTKLELDIFERSLRYSIDRARSEAALRESEARHRSLFERLPIGLFRTKMDGELLAANPALEELLGGPDRDALEFVHARNFFVNHTHRQAFLDQLDQYGVVRGFDTHVARPDGRVVRLRVAAHAHRAADGTPLYVEGAVEDVTDEHEARGVHGQAARFAWLSEASGLGVVVLDLHGMVLDANPAFLRLVRHDLAEVRGRPAADLVSEQERGTFAEELARVSGGGTDMSESRMRYRGPDDTPVWTRTRAGLVRNEEGAPDHLVLLVEDLSEL